MTSLSRYISQRIDGLVSNSFPRALTIGAIGGGAAGITCAAVLILAIGLPDVAPKQFGFAYCAVGIIAGVLSGCAIVVWRWPQEPTLRMPQCYPDIGDAETRKARAALQKNDWRPAKALLAKITDNNDLEFFIDLINASPSPRAPFEDWTDQEPDNGLAWLVRGGHSLHWAWEARGRGPGSTVTRDGHKAFIERLELSVKELQHAVKLRPHDPTPWGYLIRSALGLDSVREKLNVLLNEARRRDAQAVMPHINYFTNQCAKWYGSDEEMFAFVRKVAAQAGEGSDLHVLIAMAHWEYSCNFDVDDDDDLDDQYFLQPEVRAEILKAYQRSLGSSKYVAHQSSIEYQNYFMLCLHESVLSVHAQEELLLMNGRLTRLPWAYFVDPLGRYHRLLSSLNLS